MTVRYPRLKWDVLGWDVTSVKALTAAEAYNSSGQARIGFYDDGFMGDARHFAMFQLPGEGDFTAQDTQFVVMEGELSAETAYNTRNGQVIVDATRYHQVSLTHHRGSSDGGSVYDKWKANGNWEDMLRRMGYRYRLLESTAPETASPESSFQMTIKMINDGFARLHNPRLVEVVLRRQDHSHEFRIRAGQGLRNQLWLPGPGETNTLGIAVAIPPDAAVGAYEVFLNLPDPYPSLHDRPEYSIRLANEGIWEMSSGFNRLGHIINISR